MLARRPARSGHLWLLAGMLSAGIGAGQLEGAHAGAPPADLQLELVVGGFNSPVAVRHSGDGTGRLFVVERSGVIWIYDLVSGQLLPSPFLDIQNLVESGGEQGLLGLAFHPEFVSNGYFFVNYTRDPGPGLDRTVVARYRVSGNPDAADLSSAVVLLEIEQDFGNHNGGNLLFGADGYLYIGMGDGGAGGDPLDRAQDLTTLLGKMLRIDVDATPPDEPNELCGLAPNAYGIPPGNPFVGSDGTCDEIWAYGLRNPWRWSFDRKTGDLLIADVGQGAVEEVDFQPANSSGGENYGWSCMEGNSIVNFNPCDGAPLVPPIFTYSHALGCSITGGYVYRGPISSLRGTYIVGDYCSGRIWFGTGAGSTWSFSEWMDTGFTISSFGEDENGNVYLVDFGTDAIYRFALPASSGAGEVPDGSGESAALSVDLADTGEVVLDWDVSCRDTDTDYEIYEGPLGDFDAHVRRFCTTNGETTKQFVTAQGNRYYLVVPHNGARDGSYGRNSHGLERPAGTTACRDQALAGC